MAVDHDGDDSDSNQHGAADADAKTPADVQASQNKEVQSPSASGSSSHESWRHVVGRGMNSLSDVINEHVAAARYATIASIVLLSAFGLVNTPLFYRFKTVKDIPSSYFLQRRAIHGRLVRVVEENNLDKEDVEKPILCLVRHLSPAGRFLSRSAFEFLMKCHPAVGEGKSDEDLLRVEIAAVKESPLYVAPGYAEQRGEWLHRLADKKAPICCQLLSRRARVERAPKRRTSALAEFHQPASEEQTAVCRIRYRPGGSIFRRDLAESLVRHGRAGIASGMFISMDNWTVMDTSDRVEDLKKDTKYMSQLEKAEYVAAKELEGMWADPIVRDCRQDIAEEIKFEEEANAFQKAWRWLQG